MTFEDLLNDVKIADETELTHGDMKFKMGDLRTADKSRKAKVSAEEKRLADELRAVAAKQQELTNLAAEAAKLMEKMNTEPHKEAPQEGEIDFDTDPVFGPLMAKKWKPLEAKMTEFENAIKTINTNFGESAKFLLHDYYDRRWRDIPADKRPKDKTWKDYVKVAAEKKIFNEFNLPDPVEAFNREVEPVERQTLASENEKLKQQIAELTKQAGSPRMPRPGASGAPHTADKGAKVFDSVDALVDAAFLDPMIQEIAGKA